MSFLIHKDGLVLRVAVRQQMDGIGIPTTIMSVAPQDIVAVNVFEAFFAIDAIVL
jgi:hypothetical protein